MDFNKLVLGVLIVVPILFVGNVALQPPYVEVVRTREIPAELDVTFDVGADYAHRAKWDPWLGFRQTPKASDPSTGVGATYTWSGLLGGGGTATITEWDEGSRVVESVASDGGTVSAATSTLAFAEAGDKTQVTWTVHMTRGFKGKLLGMVSDPVKSWSVDMDKGLDKFEGAVDAEVEKRALEQQKRDHEAALKKAAADKAAAALEPGGGAPAEGSPAPDTEPAGEAP